VTDRPYRRYRADTDVNRSINLVNCIMWLISDLRGVLMGSCFEKLWP